jgi:Aspartyl protease
MRLTLVKSIVVLAMCSVGRVLAQDADTPAAKKIELNGPEVSMPLQWSRGIPVVELKINGKGPFRFFFDTGAQGSVLGLDLAKELELPVLGDARVASPGGKGVPAQNVRMDKIELGGATLRNLSALAFDRSVLGTGQDHPRGVFSAKSFPGYLVTMDYPKERLVIRSGELPAADGAAIFAYGPNQRLPELKLDVAGHEVTLHMDSGASGGLTLPWEMADHLPLEAKPVEVGRGRRVDQEVIIYGAKLKGDVKIGKFVLHNPDLRFQKLPGATGQVGNGILRKFAVTLDSKNSRIRLEEVAAGKLH